jgi:hypothetical protein
MRWLLRAIRRLVRWAAGAGRQTAPPLRQQEDVYQSAGRTEGLRTETGEEGAFRRRVTHVIGPYVSQDGVGWDEEFVQYVDENATENELLLREIRRCSCGAILAYGKTNLLGTCQICGAVVCTNEGCSARCEYCGSLTCRRHSVRFGKHEFCTRHRALAWWRLFWGRM